MQKLKLHNSVTAIPTYIGWRRKTEPFATIGQKVPTPAR